MTESESWTVRATWQIHSADHADHTTGACVPAMHGDWAHALATVDAWRSGNPWPEGFDPDTCSDLHVEIVRQTRGPHGVRIISPPLPRAGAETAQKAIAEARSQLQPKEPA